MERLFNYIGATCTVLELDKFFISLSTIFKGREMRKKWNTDSSEFESQVPLVPTNETQTGVRHIMEQERPFKKQGFCEKNKCILLVFGATVMAMAAVLLITLFDKGLRFENTKQPDKLEWWQTTIVYQIYPRSFQDSNGDGVGDLQGIRSRLYYLKYLNVGAIWINPFYKSPMRDFGYDVSDYREVDPIFGTMDDFEQLVTECHKKDIKVIVDLIPNHTSNDSDWFNSSRHAGNTSSIFRDFYIWNPGKYIDGKRNPPNNWQSNFGGSSWTFDPVRGEYYYHNYLSSQPDLNYRHPPVLEEIDKVVRFWLDKGVDGFRIDAVTYLFESEDLSLNIASDEKNKKKYTKNQPEIYGVVQRWRSILDEFEKKDGNPRMLFAETNSISEEDRQNYYNSGAIPFYFKLISAKKRCKATAQCFLTLIKEGLNVGAGRWPNFVIGNHDNRRISDTIGRDYVDVMNIMLLTLPGTPTTYYGEELGMRSGNYTGLPPKDTKAISSGDVSESRDPERNPMQWNDSINAGFTTSSTPWLPVTPNTDYKHINVKTEMEDKNSHMSIYKKLAHLRQTPPFQTTAIELPQKVENVLVYTRGDNPNKYIVILNFGKTESSVNVQFLNTLYTTGVVELSNFGKEKQEIELSEIVLKRGEGMVVKLVS